MERRDENEPATAADNPFESTFDDEFAVHTPEPSEYEFNLADGPERAESSVRPTAREESAVRRSISLNASSDTKRTIPQSSQPQHPRSSIAKNRDFLATDPSRGPMPSRVSRVIAESTPRQSTDSPRRSSSRASSYAPYDRSGTPGLSGPSHPYGMYPQTGVPRSASITTTSTARHPPSTTQSITSPSHPYGLYSQNGLPVGDDDDGTVDAVPAIQLGFPGRNADFHRQLGPDGEEQDIIGPDGHTEQLPPYSKYPDANEKVYAARAATPLSPTPSHESQNTLVQLQSQNSQPNEEGAPSEAANSGTTIAASEKSWQEKNWKERRKTRILGIPFWLILVALGCLVFVSVVIGGAIGGFLAKEREEKNSHHQSMNTATMIDATSIPVPTGVPPLPTGQFVLPLGEPQETEQNCLTNANQVKAWSCDIPPPPLMIETETSPSGAPVAQIYPAPPAPNAPTYQYGPQPPNVFPMQKLQFVMDLSDEQLGPALHFQTVYNKMVILDPTSLSTSSKQKRQESALPYYPASEPTDSFGVFVPSATVSGGPSGAPPPYGPPPYGPPIGGFHHRKNTVQVGDQPWFCFWNSTFIEAFIYMTQPVMSDNSSSSSAPTTTDNGSSHSTSSAKNNNGQQGSSSLTSTTFATSTIGNTITTPLPTESTSFPMTTGSSISFHDVRRNNNNNNNKNKNNNNNMHDDDSDDPPQFPFAVKIAERRLQNPPVPAYCQKMNVNSDGTVSTYYSNGAPVIIKLAEEDPTDAAFASAAASVIKSSAAATSTASGNAMIRRGYIERDVGAEEEWRVEERDIEARIAEAAVEEWRRSEEWLWRREDPSKSCACQWMIN